MVSCTASYSLALFNKIVSSVIHFDMLCRRTSSLHLRNASASKDLGNEAAQLLLVMGTRNSCIELASCVLEDVAFL